MSSLAATITVSPAVFPAQQVGLPISVQLSADGGTAPYQWRIATGVLPFGLGFGPAGLFSGALNRSCDVKVTVEVQDSSNPPVVGRKAYELIVSYGGVAILTTSLPGGNQTVGYSATLKAAQGQPPYAWSVLQGALPAGLSLDAAKGVIGGTPSAAGLSNFTVAVSDSQAPPSSASAPLSINIGGPPVPPPPPPPPHIRMCYGDPDLEGGEKDLE